MTWNELFREGGPVTFYGFVRLDAYYNTARANSVITPAVVLPEDGVTAKPDDDQTALDPRLTRFGMNIDGGSLGDTTLGARVEMDFASFPEGVPESRATPRIRLAYIDLAGSESGLRVGQDWDVIAPLYPAVNHELLMWNAGNLGDRRAQIQGYWRPGSGTAEAGAQFELRSSVGLTGAVDNLDLDPQIAAGTSFHERDGFDSGLPGFQTRASLSFEGLANDRRADIGAWGMFGRLEVDHPVNGKSRFDTWTVGTDVTLPISSALTARGEIWTGQALSDVRGGIGQTVNLSSGSEIDSIGGFLELWWQASDAWRLHVGSSRDDPDNGQLVFGNPEDNRTIYLGTVYDWDIGLRSGLDVIYWETDWIGLGRGDMFRIDLYFQLDF